MRPRHHPRPRCGIKVLSSTALGAEGRARLQTLGLGTAVGEFGRYLVTTSTASVDLPSVAYRLTRTAPGGMKAREPGLAATFHEHVACLLSERLAATTRALEAVPK